MVRVKKCSLASKMQAVESTNCYHLLMLKSQKFISNFVFYVYIIFTVSFRFRLWSQNIVSRISEQSHIRFQDF